MRIAIILLTIVIILNSITFYFYLKIKNIESVNSQYSIYDVYMKTRFYDKLIIFMLNHNNIQEVELNGLIFKREGNKIIVKEE
ncbi:hypothetical protein X275_07210 [Marinitoga sp. 1197]|uniref:hypothetical protein n=1 Tax=unclassified Marinitoga TaxID=2640159 RepID=UPI0006411FBF|nr:MULTISPECIES: hypothetical protein [unclassified Marinitoga]KLO22115.1 hypothetical protein X275_07210 [Marinitoga sp. 1197]KLO24695.1 hypothetical protein X274_03095 [Marinitoga sp. 1155]NUU98820.1 hypothetical protein [Marinitoga sp. 1154]